MRIFFSWVFPVFARVLFVGAILDKESCSSEEHNRGIIFYPNAANLCREKRLQSALDVFARSPPGADRSVLNRARGRASTGTDAVTELIRTRDRLKGPCVSTIENSNICWLGVFRLSRERRH